MTPARGFGAAMIVALAAQVAVWWGGLAMMAIGLLIAAAGEEAER